MYFPTAQQKSRVSPDTTRDANLSIAEVSKKAPYI